MMKSCPAKLELDSHPIDQNALAFCEKFFKDTTKRYILGRNQWARSLASTVEVEGFVDDFTDDVEFLGKPVLKIEALPVEAMVISANVLGRPLTVRSKLSEKGVDQIDYFAFRKYSGKSLEPVLFWDDFQADFKQNQDKYQWIFGLLEDERSKMELTKILNFRLSSNLNYMQGFVDAQYRQYFEDFLDLQQVGEVFVDVGGFDGYTTLEFIKRCPHYAGVHIFEPEAKNIVVLKRKLATAPNIHLYPYGLSNASQVLRFNSNGSASRISSDGDVEIQVRRLDDIVCESFSFLKMDIEGAELYAIQGAKESIKKYHPRLAIGVYHRHDDLWRIPEEILSYRDDYRIFLRHYTEGVTETVMFFVPDKTHN